MALSISRLYCRSCVPHCVTSISTCADTPNLLLTTLKLSWIFLFVEAPPPLLMTRRRELIDLAAGITGSFVSRNNDVGGYWSLGLLRSLADRIGISALQFDLMAATAYPHDPIAATVAQVYHYKLKDQLTRRRIQDFLATAVLTVEFGVQANPSAPAPTYGDPVRCTVLLVDRQDREHRCTRWTTCAPHNPARESRSARADR
jgi:hypothetical protein